MRELSEELQSAAAQVEDAARRLRQYADGVEFDPGRQRIVEERLDAIRTLKKKYGGSIEEVLAYKSRAESELEGISHRGRDAGNPITGDRGVPSSRHRCGAGAFGPSA